MGLEKGTLRFIFYTEECSVNGYHLTENLAEGEDNSQNFNDKRQTMAGSAQVVEIHLGVGEGRSGYVGECAKPSDMW